MTFLLPEVEAGGGGEELLPPGVAATARGSLGEPTPTPVPKQGERGGGLEATPLSCKPCTGAVLGSAASTAVPTCNAEPTRASLGEGTPWRGAGGEAARGPGWSRAFLALSQADGSRAFNPFSLLEKWIFS